MDGEGGGNQVVEITRKVTKNTCTCKLCGLSFSDEKEARAHLFTDHVPITYASEEIDEPAFKCTCGCVFRFRMDAEDHQIRQNTLRICIQSGRSTIKILHFHNLYRADILKINSEGLHKFESTLDDIFRSTRSQKKPYALTGDWREISEDEFNECLRAVASKMAGDAQ